MDCSTDGLLVTGRQSTGGLISGDSIRGKQQYKSLTWYANYNLALLLFQDDTNNMLFELKKKKTTI